MNEKVKDENSQVESTKTTNQSKKRLPIKQQKNLLLLLRMRKGFNQGSLLAKKIKKNIARSKTLKSINKEEK